MVVGIHADFLDGVDPLAEYLTVQGVFRIAVPIFLIINGFYFYQFLVNGKTLSWMKRVIYLYCFWMLFYSYAWFSIPEFNFISIAKLFHTIIVGYWHLWYISGMIGAAILLALIEKLKVSVVTLSLLMLLTFMIGVAIQYAGNYHVFNGSILDKLFNLDWVHRSFLFFSFPFFCFGFLINRFNLHKKVSIGLTAVLSVLGLMALLSESYINYIEPAREGGFDNFLSLIIICPALFVLFMKINMQGYSKNISYYSTGIYVIHLFFLKIFSGHTDLSGTSLTFLVIGVSLIASFFLIKINKKLKFIL